MFTSRVNVPRLVESNVLYLFKEVVWTTCIVIIPSSEVINVYCVIAGPLRTPYLGRVVMRTLSVIFLRTVIHSPSNDK